MQEPPKAAGHYQVRDQARLGVPVAAIWWVTPGEPPMLLAVLAPERVPLLAEALGEYLAGGPADAG